MTVPSTISPGPDSGAILKPLQYQLGPREVHPLHAPAVPTHDAIKASPHYPLVVTPNPMAAPQAFDGSCDPAAHLNINGDPIPFETPAFKGSIVMHFAGLPTTQPYIFHGKRRLTHTAIQGKFKQVVPASELCMGVEFIKAYNHLPHWQVLMEWGLTALAKRFSRTVKVDAYADVPYAMCPVLAACQLINVSRDGEQPADIMAATEDMRLWEPALASKQGAPLSSDKRRKWADKRAHLLGRTINTEHIWTFHMYQHIVDYAQYHIRPSITAGLVSVDMAAALEAHPLQMTVKCLNTGDYLFSVLVFHERLLYGPEKDGLRGQLVLAQLAQTAARALNLVKSVKRFFTWSGSDAAMLPKAGLDAVTVV